MKPESKNEGRRQGSSRRGNRRSGGQTRELPQGRARATRIRPDKRGADNTDFWELKLYVAGQTPRSIAAFSNLKAICEKHLAGKYRIEVVDLLKNPTLGAGDQIVALPTLVRRLPPPMRKIIGDLSDAERVLVGLQLLPAKGVPLLVRASTANPES